MRSSNASSTDYLPVIKQPKKRRQRNQNIAGKQVGRFNTQHAKYSPETYNTTKRRNSPLKTSALRRSQILSKVLRDYNLSTMAAGPLDLPSNNLSDHHEDQVSLEPQTMLNSPRFVESQYQRPKENMTAKATHLSDIAHDLSQSAEVDLTVASDKVVSIPKDS